MTQQPEKWYTTEYFKGHFMNKHVQKRVALGPSQVPMVNKQLGVITRWADAIVFEPDLVTIIEFKLEPSGKALGQLDLYENEFKKTPAFQQYWDRPIKLLLVTTRVDDGVKEVAEVLGIVYQVFRPKGIEYWEKRRFRI